MQNVIQKFRQSVIVFEKAAVKYFLLNFAHVFYLPLSKKGCMGFFLFYLDLELFAKIKKQLGSTHLFFALSLITQDLNK